MDTYNFKIAVDDKGLKRLNHMSRAVNTVNRYLSDIEAESRQKRDARAERKRGQLDIVHSNRPTQKELKRLLFGAERELGLDKSILEKLVSDFVNRESSFASHKAARVPITTETLTIKDGKAVFSHQAFPLVPKSSLGRFQVQRLNQAFNRGHCYVDSGYIYQARPDDWSLEFRIFNMSVPQLLLCSQSSGGEAHASRGHAG